ncbi:GNAT family N-acetyltransferase [Hymenobacter cellulosilyticus]|uniref:GNAT family N-acetyltransferase n=1 Tax=Hymenobacter cellulosilyticus TaxID=2932248 RepID=A0A8T9QCV9_9BACT|nr:GNAT family N-acetyltransferase [Hymenobacter cellulosilyticus]UOQ72673.1 GNAT family N-acetyltransferase [Hymenobacter cellulosilyticus]
MPVRAPSSPSDFAAYYQLRYRVLRQPWNQPLGSERADDDDAPSTTHALYSTQAGEVVGVARLHPSGPGQAQVRYMAVDPAFQGQGIGQQLLEYLEDAARRQGLTECILHARQQAVPFYERLGYRVVAPSHQLFGTIQHFLMRKDL